MCEERYEFFRRNAKADVLRCDSQVHEEAFPIGLVY